MKNRFLATDIARCFGIGRFYEELTTYVVGGARLDDVHGIDLEHPDWDSMVEVKASGSREPVKVFAEQLERHLAQRGFPYAHCCYAVWIYLNHRLDQITKKAATVRQLNQELARRTQSLYVLDARILDAILQKRGTIGVWRAGDKEASRLHTNTTWLRRFAAAPGVTLRKLGLRPRSFYIQQARARTVFEGLPLQFDYTAVLPRSAAGFVWPIHRRQKPHLAAVAASA